VLASSGHIPFGLTSSSSCQAFGRFSAWQEGVAVGRAHLVLVHLGI